MKTISIGGRPLSKLLMGFISAVVLTGLIAVLEGATDFVNLSAGAWGTTLIGIFAPLVVAYLKKLTISDLQQIASSPVVDLKVVPPKKEPPY